MSDYVYVRVCLTVPTLPVSECVSVCLTVPTLPSECFMCVCVCVCLTVPTSVSACESVTYLPSTQSYRAYIRQCL